MENKDWTQDETFLARWMADEVTPEEKATFEATEDGRYFVSLKKASEGLKAPTYDVEAEWSKLKSRNAEGKQAKQIWLSPTLRWSVAASVVILIGAFFLLAGTKTIRAPYGQHQLATLPDGSKVRLNSGSVLSYNKLDWMWSREVTLEQGEAFFEVEKGNEFRVATPEGTVTVLGTTFNVDLFEDKFRVICYTGKVAVASGDFSQELRPGYGVVLQDGEVIDQELVGATATPGWMRGVIRLRKVTFKEVLSSLERTFNMEVLNQDPSLDTLKFTGTYPMNPEIALKLVLEPLNISYSFEASKRKLTIIGRNK
ncbi:MAG: FecR domain-containing protein [Cytophagales bacterium]|nr:FecR domain-containing protein [Cytophagales bacterium]